MGVFLSGLVVEHKTTYIKHSLLEASFHAGDLRQKDSQRAWLCQLCGCPCLDTRHVRKLPDDDVYLGSPEGDPLS